MSNNFDILIDRKNTNSLKYDFYDFYKIPHDAIPLWVADMDFKSPPQVTEALHKAAEHGVYGYTDIDDEYDQIVCGWYKQHFNWDIKPEWNIKTPGVVFAIATAIKALTNESDSVLIQQPVYYPFSSVVTSNNRKLVVNELKLANGRYETDFEDFENCIIKNNVRLFLFCSPHNPIGKVWSYEELEKMGDICLKHGVKIISDEIHSDFIYDGFAHTVLANIKKEFADICISCTAPTKTFNLAGLQTSNIIISNKNMRESFEKELNKTGYSLPGIMEIAAAKAAYKYGREWLEDLLIYLQSNINYVTKKIESIDKGIKVIKPQGTYLIWIDFRKLELSDKELKDFIINKAKLWLHSGPTFGKGGSGFMRMNIACPLSVLESVMQNLKKAFE